MAVLLQIAFEIRGSDVAWAILGAVMGLLIVLVLPSITTLVIFVLARAVLRPQGGFDDGVRRGLFWMPVYFSGVCVILAALSMFFWGELETLYWILMAIYCFGTVLMWMAAIRKVLAARTRGNQAGV